MSKFKNFGKSYGKDLKNITANSALSGVQQSLRKGQLNALNSTDPLEIYNQDINDDIDFNALDINVKDNILQDALSNYDNNPSPQSFTSISNIIKGKNPLDPDNQSQDFMELSTSPYIANDTLPYVTSGSEEIENSILNELRLPDWGYDNFVNERNIFLKGFSNGLDGPNWFYFKIFFNFDTNNGLFGGILHNGTNTNNSQDQYAKSTNGAYRYLYNCNNTPGLYKHLKLPDRMVALEKFVNLLSYINTRSPWFFTSVSNIEKIANPYIKDFDSEKEINIGLLEDAIDMRVSTLFSLYKYACFDDINCKEIIPENLRKFDMTLLMFMSPLKRIHNSTDKKSNNPYSRLVGDNSKPMSFKIFKFINCEFDPSSIGGYIPNEITNNGEPYQLGKNTLKIKYDRVYEYTYNEFMNIMIGSTGMLIKPNAEIKVEESDNMIVASEYFIRDHINNLLGHNVNYALGNIYGQDTRINIAYPRKNVAYMDKGKADYLTNYYKAKLSAFNNKSNFTLDLGYNLLYNMLGYPAQKSTIPGSNGRGTILVGDGSYKVGGPLWQSKQRGELSNRQQYYNMMGNINNEQQNFQENLEKNVLNNYNNQKRRTKIGKAISRLF